MSKGLEALESIIETFYDKESEDIQIVKKELKALEIIKEHWNFEYLKSGFGSKGFVQIKPISIEDDIFLKEVLL